MSELPSTPPRPPTSESQARQWNMLCHLSALSGIVIPAGGVLGPLIVWLIKKNEIPSVDLHGKASLNFQLTVLIATLIAGVAAFVLSFFCIGFILIPIVLLLPIAGLIFAIIAAIKASNGEGYRYPYVWELVK